MPPIRSSTARHAVFTAVFCASLLLPSLASACQTCGSRFTVTKGASSIVAPGGILTYTLFAKTIFDTCNGPEMGIRSDLVTYADTFPADLVLIGINDDSPWVNRNACGFLNGNYWQCSFILLSNGPSAQAYQQAPKNFSFQFRVPADTPCGTVYTNQAVLNAPWSVTHYTNVTTTLVTGTPEECGFESSSSSSSSSSTPSSSSSSSTPASSSSAASSSSSSITPVVTIPGGNISNSTAIATNLSNNQNTQNLSIFNAGDTITVGAPNINVNTGGANVAVSATASPSTTVNNTQGAVQYQPQYPQYPSYPPPPPVYPVPQPPQQIIIEKPVVIPPPIIVQPLPQTGIGDFTGSVENTRRFLSPISGNPDGGLIATALLSLVLLLGVTGIAGVITIRNYP